MGKLIRLQGEMMERRSYTRLTLALDIRGKIAHGPLSGFHELSTIKQQIDLYDIIRVEPAETCTVTCTDPNVPCNQQNLCYKALTLLKEQCGIRETISVEIHKNIPVMGGLAGGSANAATTLQILNDLWKLHLNTEALISIGRMVGMDVPFYFIGNTAYDTEAGGICEPIETSLHFIFILAMPDFGVSTKAAYSAIDYSKIGGNVRKTNAMRQLLLENNYPHVVSLMHNDFEYSVFSQFPQLAKIKRELIDAGCETALLSGSGSTVIGIVRNYDEAEAISNRINCTTLVVSSLCC